MFAYAKCQSTKLMMPPSHGSAFRFAGTLWWESTTGYMPETVSNPFVKVSYIDTYVTLFAIFSFFVQYICLSLHTRLQIFWIENYWLSCLCISSEIWSNIVARNILSRVCISPATVNQFNAWFGTKIPIQKACVLRITGINGAFVCMYGTDKCQLSLML